MIFAILLTVSQLFGSNESTTLKIKSTKDCGTLLNWMTAKPHNPELTSCVMGQLTIHSKKHGDKIVLYDDEDHELISKENWFIIKPHNIFYVVSGISNKRPRTIRMHQLILGFPKKDIDHRNGNGLDNRRKNLRKIATSSQNKMNCGMYSNNTSGYKGVHYYYTHKKWGAQIYSNKKCYFLGLFETAKDAGIAYNIAAIKYHGEFARLNQI